MASSPQDRARTLPLRVLEHICAEELWAPGQRVLLAVSGGLDSTVMLHLLARARSGHKGHIEVCSLDHGLRVESASEVEGVRRQAEALRLPFHAFELHVSPGPNLAARAREARRAALLSVGADRIATAHQRDDQAETVLYRLLRGSGGTGLAGMAALDPPWCRPLLREPREVLRAWAEAEGLSWVEDPSNASSQRGQLRHLLPLLDEIQGGAAEALARSARLLARDDDFLEELTDSAWRRVAVDGGLSWAAWKAEPPAIQLRLLRRLCAGCRVQVRADQLEAVLRWRPQGGGRLGLSGEFELRYDAGILSLQSSGRIDEP